MKQSEPVTCQYCDSVAPLVSGKVVYPHRPDLGTKYFYLCRPCSAWVGCHPNSTKPLGVLANNELRQAKRRAHASFDSIWRGHFMKRGDAYAWLSKQMGKPPADTHIGMMTVEECAKVCKIVGCYFRKKRQRK